MLPIRDDNPTSRTAWVTIAIIALNVLAFLLWEPTFAGSSARGQLQQETFFYCHAAIPWEIIHHTNLADGGEAARRALTPLVGSASNAEEFQRFLAAHCPNKNWL